MSSEEPSGSRIVVVGTSLAGLRAAETLRQAGYEGEVIVVGEERHRPYDRPPLSKQLLAGDWEPDRIALRPADSFDDLDVGWRLGHRAVGVDLDERRVELEGGDRVAFDGLIIATGAAPRRIPGQEGSSIVHELRTLDDALALREELRGGGRRVVVVGAGFIGLEVAATAHRAGNEVVVLEGAEAPLVRGLGVEMGTAIGELLIAAGIDIRCGVLVEALGADRVTLQGGEVVPADVIVVGIGVAPVTGWLDGSGIARRDGVVCDETLQVLDEAGARIRGIYAAGDVARWTNAHFGEEMRVEHWTNAAEQGAVAAKNLLAELAGDAGEPYAAVPFFWSDQLDLRIQFLGRADPDGEVRVVAGAPAEGKFLALFERDGRLYGALGVNAPRWVMPMRKLLMDGSGWSEALDAAQELAQR
jgi:NADPH-dependent 2,4-dienoyl-CoA reductase/sulfur reductase-like enzyme